jgi:hypothetical protein
MAGYLNGDDEGEPGRRIAGRKWLPQVLPTHYRDVGTGGGGGRAGQILGPPVPKILADTITLFQSGVGAR